MEQSTEVENQTVGLSSCYSQGTLIEMKMESVKGEISWNANNEKIAN